MSSGVREGLILSLVSSLQMAQQSALNALSHGLGTGELAAAGAAFPLGKLVTTVWMVVRPAAEPRDALSLDAVLLLVAAVIGLVPATIFLAVARFFMGAGAGLGFVCAPVLLTELVPHRNRPAAFLVLGLAFSASTLVSNVLPVLQSDAYLVVVACCAFSALTGLLYLWLRPKKEASNPLEEEKNLLALHRPSRHPIGITNVLMLLNVTIGVPIVLGYSILIFREFGASPETSLYLGVAFPVAQMLTLAYLNQHNDLDRKMLVVGGYAVSVGIQCFLLLTSAYDLLPPDQKTGFLCFWLFVLSVAFSIPCNTALCVIAGFSLFHCQVWAHPEQFPTPAERLRYGSSGRALMWLATSISTSSFMVCVREFGFTLAFAPYVVCSILLLAVLVWMYPKE